MKYDLTAAEWARDQQHVRNCQRKICNDIAHQVFAAVPDGRVNVDGHLLPTDTIAPERET